LTEEFYVRCSPNPVHFLYKFNFLQVLIVSFDNPDKGGFQELFLHSIFLRGYVAQGAMWPIHIVILPPFFDFLPGILQTQNRCSFKHSRRKLAFFSGTQKLHFVRRTIVWDIRPQAHNPEVVGSNPTPTTKIYT